MFMRSLLASLKADYATSAIRCALFLLLAATATLSASAQSVTDVSLNVTNQTTGFQVVSVERDLEYVKGSEFLRVSFRNDYDKAIVSYAIVVGKGSSVQTDFMYSEAGNKIAPGETTTWRNALSPGMLAEGISIEAVVFDDGTGDGDAGTIKGIKDQWEGGDRQISRILSILDAALSSSEAESSDVLYELEARVSSLSIEPDNSFQPRSQAGLNNQREGMLVKLKQLRDVVEATSGVTAREGLVRLKQRLESYQVRLRAAGVGI
jgi:hypothetical protein